MIKYVLKRMPGARPLAAALGLSGRGFLLKLLPKHSVGAEVGVHKADFSAQILRTVKPTQLHLIDPWQFEESPIYNRALYGGMVKGGQTEMDERYEATCLRFASEIRLGRVIVHRGYSSYVLKDFPDDYFDWVYIDGNHLYEFVMEDLELSFQKTKVGGYITGDDYGTRGGWWKEGVERAVDEFVQKTPIHLVGIRNRQFILRK